MAQSETERLADAIEELNKKLSRGGSISGGGSSSGGSGSTPKSSGSGVVDRFVELAGAAGNGLQKVWEGSAKVADGFGAITGALKDNGGLLGNALGGLAGKIGDSVLKANEKANEFGSYGANFNNNLAEMDRLVKGARLTHEEYGDILKRNAIELNGLGSTMNRSQQNFLEFTKGLQESDVVNQLAKLGLQTEEVTEVAKAAMAQQRGLDMSDIETKNAAIDSAIRLTASMDETTRITGLSRKQQEDDLRKRMEDATVQVAISRLDKDAGNRFRESMQDMSGLPEAAKRVFQETFTGGLRTKEGAESMAAMGSAGPELQKAAEAMKAAKTDEEKSAARLQLNKAIEAVDKWQNSDGFKDMVQYGSGGVTQRATEAWTNNQELKQIQTKIAEEKNKGNEVDEATARKMIRDEAHKAQKGLDAEGKPVEGAEVATTINKADRSLKDLGAGASKVFGDIVKSGNDVVKTFDGINTALRPRKQEEATPGAVLKEVGGFVSDTSLGDAFKKAAARYAGADQLSHEQAAASPPSRKFADGTPEFEKFLSSNGFASMFTSFKPTGEPAELHGNEIVANENQMKRLVAQVMTVAMPPSSQNTTATAKTSPEPVKLPEITTPEVKKTEEKPAEPTKVEVKAAEPPKAEVKPAEVKPAEEKKPETADANRFKFVEQQGIAQLGEHFNKLIKVTTAAAPTQTKTVEQAAVTAMNQNFEHLNKAVSGSLTEVKTQNAEKTKAVTTAAAKPKAPDVSKLDDSLLNIAKFNKALQSGDISKIGMSQMDLSDSGKAAEDKLGPSAARMKLQKRREELENAAFDYEQMKAANTKPNAESAERLAKKKEEVAKLALDYENDLIITKGKLKQHADEEAKHAEVKNKTAQDAHAKQVAQAIESEKKIKEQNNAKSPKEMSAGERDLLIYGSANKVEPPKIAEPLTKVNAFEDLGNKLGSSFKSLNPLKPAELTKLPEITTKYEPEKKEPEEKGFFDTISDSFSKVGSTIGGFFKEDNKPAFAKGNVKYETIPQEELDAANKRAQAKIGEVDNSPEAIAAQKAELARQADSSRYKQPPKLDADKAKDLAKVNDKAKVEPPKADVKKPPETKEQAHLKEMYKKFGLERFDDYNARMSAEVKQSHATIKDAKPATASITTKDVAPPPAATPVKKEEPVKQVAAPAPTPAPATKDVTLKDIHEALIQLNKTMAQMAHHTDTISSNSHKQIKATNSLSGNRIG